MIKLSRLNDSILFINPDLIESFVSQPDTLIIMTNGNKVIVKESPDEILQKIIEFKAKVLAESEKLK